MDTGDQRSVAPYLHPEAPALTASSRIHRGALPASRRRHLHRVEPRVSAVAGLWRAVIDPANFLAVLEDEPVIGEVFGER